MKTPIQHTTFTFDIAKEQRKGLEFLLKYYSPYTRAHGAILQAMEDNVSNDNSPSSDNAKPNKNKQLPRIHRTTFFVCSEDGCNALCPPEMFKCSKHRESTDTPLKTDDPEEFYINPKFKKQ